MDINDLEKIAEKEKIEIINYKMKTRKARIIKNDCYCIFMDYCKISSKMEEKCLLAEELGHYYYSAYYCLNSNDEFIKKQEYRAMKWRSLICVPLNSILSCFNSRNI